MTESPLQQRNNLTDSSSNTSRTLDAKLRYCMSCIASASQTWLRLQALSRLACCATQGKLLSSEGIGQDSEFSNYGCTNEGVCLCPSYPVEGIESSFVPFDRLSLCCMVRSSAPTAANHFAL